jgi:hypothetical protein
MSNSGPDYQSSHMVLHVLHDEKICLVNTEQNLQLLLHVNLADTI